MKWISENEVLFFLLWPRINWPLDRYWSADRELEANVNWTVEIPVVHMWGWRFSVKILHLLVDIQFKNQPPGELQVCVEWFYKCTWWFRPQFSLDFSSDVFFFFCLLLFWLQWSVCVCVCEITVLFWPDVVLTELWLANASATVDLPAPYAVNTAPCEQTREMRLSVDQSGRPLNGPFSPSPSSLPFHILFTASYLWPLHTSPHKALYLFPIRSVYVRLILLQSHTTPRALFFHFFPKHQIHTVGCLATIEGFFFFFPQMFYQSFVLVCVCVCLCVAILVGTCFVNVLLLRGPLSMWGHCGGPCRLRGYFEVWGWVRG